MKVTFIQKDKSYSKVDPCLATLVGFASFMLHSAKLRLRTLSSAQDDAQSIKLSANKKVRTSNYRQWHRLIILLFLEKLFKVFEGVIGETFSKKFPLIIRSPHKNLP